MTTHKFIETIVIVITQSDTHMAQNSIKKIQNTITCIHHMARHQTCEKEVELQRRHMNIDKDKAKTHTQFFNIIYNIESPPFFY